MASNAIRFTRPLRSVVLAGTPVPPVPKVAIPPPPPPAPKGASLEERIAEVQALAYKQGFEEGVRQTQTKLEGEKAARFNALEAVLKKLNEGHESLISQVGHVMPRLVNEAVRRVLAGAELPAETVARIIYELLTEVHPGAGAIEIILCERDLQLMKENEALMNRFTQNYPGITFVADRHLAPGDCVLKSKFGTIDGRMGTKLENLDEILQ